MSIRYVSDTFAASAVACLMFFAVFTFGKTLESHLLPVVKNFTVGKVTRTETGFDIAGILDKVRPCEYKGMVWYRLGPDLSKRVSMAFRDQDDGSSDDRATGVQAFGPWSLGRRPDATGPDIYWGEVRHKCHPFWKTSTTLGPVDFSKID